MVQDAKRLRRALWLRACRFDGIDPAGLFVVFSKANPYVERYNKVCRMIDAGARLTNNSGQWTPVQGQTTNL